MDTEGTGCAPTVPKYKFYRKNCVLNRKTEKQTFLLTNINFTKKFNKMSVDKFLSNFATALLSSHVTTFSSVVPFSSASILSSIDSVV